MNSRQVRKHYTAPDVSLLHKHLPDIGTALDTGFCNLALDFSLENADKLLAKLEGARVTVQQIRRSLAEGGRK